VGSIPITRSNPTPTNRINGFSHSLSLSAVFAQHPRITHSEKFNQVLCYSLVSEVDFDGAGSDEFPTRNLAYLRGVSAYRTHNKRSSWGNCGRKSSMVNF
jgi:hypothetical protein